MYHTNSNNILLSESIADDIREYILDNNMKPGDKLPNEFQLAEMFSVGRGTIREAIKKLSYDGFVNVIRGNGTFVAEPDQEQHVVLEEKDPLGLQQSEKDKKRRALEYLDVRLMIEPEIAAMAAENALYQDCKKLQEYNEETTRLIRSGEDHIPSDIKFHKQIAECTHNQIVINLMEILVTGIPLFTEFTRNTVAWDSAIHHEHITNAIKANDPTGARCAMITHLNSNRLAILGGEEDEKT